MVRSHGFYPGLREFRQMSLIMGIALFGCGVAKENAPPDAADKPHVAEGRASRFPGKLPVCSQKSPSG